MDMGFCLDMSDEKRIWGTLDPFFEPGPILGRKVANVQFLDALLRADSFDEYHFFLGDRLQGRSLQNHVGKTAPHILEEGRLRVFDRRELPGELGRTDYHCFHLSDCITTQPYLASLRNQYSKRVFPITGVIHSLSYADYGEAFLRHLWPGNTGRDSIVCTSSLGRQSVQEFFTWLRESYSLSETTHPAPRLDLVPLGVDVDEFAPSDRKDDGPVKLLVFGRISHHSKMDLLPLVRALHRLVTDGMSPDSVELVLAGWAEDNDDFLPRLKGFVQNVGIPLTMKLRPSDEEKRELFQSADIFISIADNPQETFGITLLEAGAFGLPTVASEYDGYRDIIVDGETGLLVPTIGPDETNDADLLAPLLYDNQYHLLLAQRTAVEIAPLAESLKQLIESPDLRMKMGKAARSRVVEHFTWTKVMEDYIALWDDLNSIPVDAESLQSLNHPQAMPFGRLFGHYTTTTLSPETMLCAGRTGEAFYRGRDFPTLYSGMSLTIDPDLAKKLVFLARKSVDSATLIRKFMDVAPTLNESAAKNHVLWAIKHDILERIE